MAFTSNWNKQRWAKAREYKDYYERTHPDSKDISVKEFYKNENPVLRDVVRYEVTYEMNYKGKGYEFYFPQETAIVYAFDNPENEKHLKENFNTAISDVFKGGARSWVSDKLDDTDGIKIKKSGTVRGVDTQKVNFNEVDIDQFKGENFYLKNTSRLNVNKKNKGDQTPNKNTYTLDVWF